MSKEALELSEFNYLKAISFMICESNPVANAFVIVAHENYLPIYQAAGKLASSSSSKQLPRTIDDHILLLNRLMKGAVDEITQRRFSWFYIAAMVMRATQIADLNLIYRPQAITIWQSLVDAGGNIRHVLDTTKLWKEDEKEWFSDIKTQIDGRMYVFACLVPKWAREYIAF